MGIKPIKTIRIAGVAASNILSSAAYMYVVTAKVSKLKVELAFSKFKIFSLSQSQPSLDDVYLQATGKTLQDAELYMTGKRDLKKESKQSMR